MACPKHRPETNYYAFTGVSFGRLGSPALSISCAAGRSRTDQLVETLKFALSGLGVVSRRDCLKEGPGRPIDMSKCRIARVRKRFCRPPLGGAQQSHQKPLKAQKSRRGNSCGFTANEQIGGRK